MKGEKDRNNSITENRQANNPRTLAKRALKKNKMISKTMKRSLDEDRSQGLDGCPPDTHASMTSVGSIRQGLIEGQTSPEAEGVISGLIDSLIETAVREANYCGGGES